MKWYLAVFLLLASCAGNDRRTSSHCPDLEFSHRAGFYSEPFALKICGRAEATIRYTLDGSLPGPDSPVYTSPIYIDHNNAENNLSEIPTTPPFSDRIRGWPRARADSRAWLPPFENVFKGVVVRAAEMIDDEMMGEAMTATFFVSEKGGDRYHLPVISLVTDSENFFGQDTGIYVYGRHGNPRWKRGPANFRQRRREWERPVHIEYFSRKGEPLFKQKAGARIHGGGGRWSAQKSIRLYARREYGQNRFRFPFFGSKGGKEFNRLVLRNGGHMPNLFPRDDLAASIIDASPLETLQLRHVVVFLNGEYWGIHTLKERIDHHYISRKYRVKGENIAIRGIRNVQHGAKDAADELNEIVGLLRQNEDNSSILNRIERLIDVDHFFEYMIAQIFMGNTDWPTNNVRSWRVLPSDDSNPGPLGFGDGRWRWLIFDLDAAFGSKDEEINPGHDTLSSALSRGQTGQLLSAILEDETYRLRFLSRLAVRLTTIYAAPVTTSRLEKLEKKITPELYEHVKRWRYPSTAVTHSQRKREEPSLDRWNKTLKGLKAYFDLRPENVRQQAVNHFALEGIATLRLDLRGLAGAELWLNDYLISGQSASEVWEGRLFSGVPVTLSVVPQSGSQFVSWGAEGFPDTKKIRLLLSSDIDLAPTVVIEPAKDA